MVEFINKVTGSTMYVADERVEENKAAGHIPAAEPVAKKPETKATAKRTTKRK